MKKNIIPIIIAALIIAQLVLMMKVNDLQRQLDNARTEINNQSNYARNEINAIYANVDEKLKQEASPIEIASTELGTPDAASLTTPVTFSVTPKEVSKYTAVSLEIDGEQIQMNKNGTTFTAKINYDIFGSTSPLIVIDENGVKKTTQDYRIDIRSMKDSLFPVMHPQFSGETSYSGGTYKRKGSLNTEVKGAASGISLTEIRFVVKVDDEIISDEIISDEIIPNGIFDWKVDKTIPLSDGQVCTMLVIATDSIGLEHRYTVGDWIGGANAQREQWFDDEQIYSTDGKLLWKVEP